MISLKRYSSSWRKKRKKRGLRSLSTKVVGNSIVFNSPNRCPYQMKNCRTKFIISEVELIAVSSQRESTSKA